MAARRVYHVVIDPAHGWKVEAEGAADAAARADTRVEAVAIARRLGQAAEVGRVVVHRADGSVETEWTYGSDPNDGRVSHLEVHFVPDGSAGADAAGGGGASRTWIGPVRRRHGRVVSRP